MGRYILTACYSFFFLLLSMGRVLAQAPEIMIERLTTDNGLTNNVVNYVIQDNHGFLWVGTGDGLNRYDGYEFKQYRHDPMDSTTLSHSRITSIATDSSGILWVGTENGLNRFDPATEMFTHFVYAPNDSSSLSHNIILALHVDQEGMLWVGTFKGLNQFNDQDNTFKRYLHDPDDEYSLSHNTVSNIYEDTRGTLWFGTPFPFNNRNVGGLNRLDRAEDRFIRYEHVPGDTLSLIDNRIEAILEDQNGVLWVATVNNGLHHYDQERDAFRRIIPSSRTDDMFYPAQPQDTSGYGLFGEWIRELHQDRSGIFWIGTFPAGLARYNPSTKRLSYARHDAVNPNSLAENRITEIYEDRQGILWIATFYGLNKIDPYAGKFINYTSDSIEEANLYDMLVEALYEDSYGNLWVGTWNGLYTVDQSDLSGGRTTGALKQMDIISGELINDILGDREGQIWIAGEGLIKVDPEGKTYKRYVHEKEDTSSLSAEWPYLVREDAKGHIWVVTGKGLDRFDPKTETFTHYHIPNEEAPEKISAILESSSEAGTFWIGTRSSLYLFDGTTGVSEVYLQSYQITDMLEDREGHVWVATHSQGLMRLDPATRLLTVYRVKDGLASNDLNAILEDEEGNIWISTTSGLSKFDLSDSTFRNYGLKDGLQTNRFNNGSAYRGASGFLYFGGDNGLVAFDPSQVKHNPYPPQLAFTDFKISNVSVSPGNGSPLTKPVHLTDSITLAYTQNDVSFTFAGLHFDAPGNNLYSFYLEGYEDSWREPDILRTAAYTNLPPGEYVFHAKASNNDGIWSEKDASISITILPPWWQTKWAYGVFALCFVGFIVGLNHIQRVQLIRREREQTRIREARLKVQATEERMRMLEDLDKVKSRFFTNISHEFRTPLTLILGPVHDALDGKYGRLSPFWLKQFTIIQKNGHRLKQLIEQLLDLSRLQSGRMMLQVREQDLVSFLRGLMQSFVSLAERRAIALSMETTEAQISLFFDADKMEKLFSNLLSNAFKFTEDHGKIHIRVSCKRSFAEVRVSDTGKGIPPDEVPHIFDRFYQVDKSISRSQGGAGIGLALAKEFVELHKGKISVDSETGIGSTFIVQLPLGCDHLEQEDFAEQDIEQDAHQEKLSNVETGTFQIIVANSEQEDSSDPSVDGHASRVLIIDDNEDMRAYLSGHLKAYYHLEMAENGAEGLERARSTRPDLIISDVMMPGMDGFELCRRIKLDNELNHIPVLLLTAKASKDDKIYGLEVGADDYLYKPFNADELSVRVENLITIRKLLRRKYSEQFTLMPGELQITSEEMRFLERVKEVVEQHIASHSFTVEQLADEVGLGKRQLQRRLKNSTNLSVGGYIRSVRMQRAAQLLEQKWGNVSEVAFAVGYKSAKHFSKLFYQIYGVLPSDYSTKESS